MMWIVAITVVICVALSIFISGGDNTKYEFNNIDVAKFVELYKGEEKSIVYIGRPTCSYCVEFYPILGRVADENELLVNYLDLDTQTEAQMKALLESDEYFKTNWGTPLTIVVSNSKIEDAKINGKVDKKTTEDFFKQMGFIK